MLSVQSDYCVHAVTPLPPFSGVCNTVHASVLMLSCATNQLTPCLCHVTCNVLSLLAAVDASSPFKIVIQCQCEGTAKLLFA